MRATTAEGYSYESVPTVSGQPPYPANLLARSKNLLHATLGLFGQLGLATDVGPRMFAKYPVHAERARRAAGVVGVEPVGLLTANLCYDLLMGSSVMGCSTLALAGQGRPGAGAEHGLVPGREDREGQLPRRRGVRRERRVRRHARRGHRACRSAGSACA